MITHKNILRGLFGPNVCVGSCAGSSTSYIITMHSSVGLWSEEWHSAAHFNDNTLIIVCQDVEWRVDLFSESDVEGVRIRIKESIDKIIETKGRQHAKSNSKNS